MARLDLIKERLRVAIRQSGLSQTDIAKKVSVSQSCIAHYVKGDILPTLETFAELCDTLDIDPSYILGLSNA